MKSDGSPDTPGEKRYQAGAVAETVLVDGVLVWQITQDGRVSHTKMLSHTSHWGATP